MQENKHNATKNRSLVIIAGALAALVMLISFVVALSKFADPSDGLTDTSADVSDASGTDTSDVVSDEVSDVSEEISQWGSTDGYYDTLVMENYPYANASSYNGPLAVISAQNGSYPVLDESKIVKIANKKTPGVYGLSNTSLAISEDAMTDLDRFVVSFYEQVPKNGLIIDKGYTSADALVSSDASIDLASGYSIKFSIYNSNYKFSSPEFAYLKEQSYKYGIIQRYPADKESYTGFEESSTIYRYVGLAHSMYMNHYRHSLEEYIDKLRTQKVIEYKSDLELNTMYVIYYVPVDTSVETTYVPLPSNENCTYTVSGDGGKGFIVTVKVPIE
jgi:D-alanyl-D-alanine carboxypeptidase